MSSRRVKTIIQQGIRELKQDHRGGFDLGGIDIPYSRGKSFDYMIHITAMNAEYTQFSICIVEYGGKKRRARDRHMENHMKNGEEILRFDPVYDETGTHKWSTMLPCCDNEPDIGKGRIVRWS